MSTMLPGYTGAPSRRKVNLVSQKGNPKVGASIEFIEPQGGYMGSRGGAFGDPMEEYLRRESEANKANESRYAGLLSASDAARAAIGKRYDEASAALGSFGRGERMRIGRQFADRGGQIDEAAITAGRYNTSIRDRDRTLNAESEQQANLDLSDRIAAQQIALSQARARDEYGVDSDKMGFMERRSDVGPDLETFARMQENAYANDASGGGFGDLLGVFGGVQSLRSQRAAQAPEPTQKKSRRSKRLAPPGAINNPNQIGNWTFDPNASRPTINPNVGNPGGYGITDDPWMRRYRNMPPGTWIS